MEKKKDLVYTINQIVGASSRFVVYMKKNHTYSIIFKGDMIDWMLNIVSDQIEHNLVKRIHYKKNVYYLEIDWIEIELENEYEEFLEMMKDELW